MICKYIIKHTYKSILRQLFTKNHPCPFIWVIFCPFFAGGISSTFYTTYSSLFMFCRTTGKLVSFCLCVCVFMFLTWLHVHWLITQPNCMLLPSVTIINSHLTLILFYTLATIQTEQLCCQNRYLLYYLQHICLVGVLPLCQWHSVTVIGYVH